VASQRELNRQNKLLTNEKTTFKSEKCIFYQGNMNFSSSIRIASEEAVLSW
jgi:hypothetical protein